MLKSAIKYSTEITSQERTAAKEAIRALDKFLRELKITRNKDMEMVRVLEKHKNSGSNSDSLFKIKHHLKRFQREVKDRYVKLIFDFAGKKDENTMQVISEGYIHSLGPLEKDTVTRNMKASLQDSMQHLVEFMEEFIEGFEDFDNPDQIQNIIDVSKKVDQIVSSIKNVVDSQIKPHFEKDILKVNRAEEIQKHIIKRARLIQLLGD